MWQMGSGAVIGGGFGHFFNYAPAKIEYAIDRFTMVRLRIHEGTQKKYFVSTHVFYLCMICCMFRHFSTLSNNPPPPPNRKRSAS